MKTKSRRKRWGIFLVGAFAIYLLGYLHIRSTATQRWERDGHNYVIFPKRPIAVYYLYRPMSLVDGRLTGMRFHIGLHEN